MGFVVELHSKGCACKGGSFMTVEGKAASSCPRQEDGGPPAGAIVISAEQWRELGKPKNAEEYQASTARAAAPATGAERREVPRLPIRLRVLVQELQVKPGVEPRRELAETENLGKGGAQVRTSLRFPQGAVIGFYEPESKFKTRAVVQNAFTGNDGQGRLNLRFIDAQAPDTLLQTS